MSGTPRQKRINAMMVECIAMSQWLEKRDLLHTIHADADSIQTQDLYIKLTIKSSSQDTVEVLFAEQLSEEGEVSRWAQALIYHPVTAQCRPRHATLLEAVEEALRHLREMQEQAADRMRGVLASLEEESQTLTEAADALRERRG